MIKLTYRPEFTDAIFEVECTLWHTLLNGRKKKQRVLSILKSALTELNSAFQTHLTETPSHTKQYVQETFKYVFITGRRGRPIGLIEAGNEGIVMSFG
jgi:hypothetical protein